MGIVSKETGVLKLVRAGGIVELYKHPIEAARIMERYPRHCVTRPDFFRNPYIVVKPESVLRPGKVFFIVPYHTVYRLLKSRGYRCNRRCTQDTHNEAVNKQTVDHMENVDTYFFQKIVQVENVRSKKPNNRHFGTVSDHEDPTAAATTSRNGGLKPCLKKNTPDRLARFQQAQKVRFMLPDEEDDDDDDDDEKWDNEFWEF